MADTSEFQTTNFEHAHYTGEGGTLFGLALKTYLLSVLTLGIYRFWSKTRIRKYIWSATRFQGDAFEYTGTGLEKFLGFLIAVVFLAVYLGIVNLLLFFAGIHFTTGVATEAEALANAMVIGISFLALVPWIFFAVYRSRRYMLARTRFRGIRFGMEKGAGGYVWRALFYSFVVGITLGLLLPLRTFRLAAYMNNRTWYGDARFVQGGSWAALYRGMLHLVIGMVLLIAALSLMGGSLEPGAEQPVLAVLLFIVGYLWLIFGGLYYQVKSFAYLASNLTLEGAVLFRATPSSASILGRVILGSIGLIGLGLVAGFIFYILGLALVSENGMGQPSMVQFVIFLGLNLLVLASMAAAALAMITQPIIAHIVDTSAVGNAQALANVSQREADTGADADGFADALDMGGAI